MMLLKTSRVFIIETKHKLNRVIIEQLQAGNAPECVGRQRMNRRIQKLVDNSEFSAINAIDKLIVDLLHFADDVFNTTVQNLISNAAKVASADNMLNICIFIYVGNAPKKKKKKKTVVSLFDQTASVSVRCMQ
jgi:hypothetical protein